MSPLLECDKSKNTTVCGIAENSILYTLFGRILALLLYHTGTNLAGVIMQRFFFCVTRVGDDIFCN